MIFLSSHVLLLSEEIYISIEQPQQQNILSDRDTKEEDVQVHKRKHSFQIEDRVLFSA